MTQFLALILSVAAPGPADVPAALPGRSEAAAAFFEYEADACRAMIDVCEGGVGVRSPEFVTGLRCRTGRRGFAACRF